MSPLLRVNYGPAGPRSRRQDAARIARVSEREGSRGDDGLAALELAILTPLFIAMLLLVVGFGRVSHGRQLVDQAAAAAARAAALTNAPGEAGSAAQQVAQDTLSQAGISCGKVHVDVNTGAFRPGGFVDVTVRCTADLSRLALAGLPGSVTRTFRAENLTLTSPSPAPLQIDGELIGQLPATFSIQKTRLRVIVP